MPQPIDLDLVDALAVLVAHALDVDPDQPDEIRRVVRAVRSAARRLRQPGAFDLALSVARAIEAHKGN